MRHRYFTLDVFTDRVFGGNPLAVFPDAATIPEAAYPLIARELNLSETVFVLPPREPRHAARLRIFTPGMELPFAGHPTVGTAILLALLGRIPPSGAEATIVLEEEVGPVRVVLRWHEGMPAFAELTATRAPEVGPAPPPPDVIAALLGLSATDIAGGRFAPEAVSCGVPFLFITVRDRDALRSARVQIAVWEKHIARSWAPNVYVLTLDADHPERVFARMFAPAMGLPEDPATGAAATALGGYLGARMDRQSWKVEQGVEMGRPSLLHVDADRGPDGRIAAVRVGGAAVMVGEGSLEVPELLGISAPQGQ